MTGRGSLYVLICAFTAHKAAVEVPLAPETSNLTVYPGMLKAHWGSFLQGCGCSKVGLRREQPLTLTQHLIQGTKGAGKGETWRGRGWAA